MALGSWASIAAALLLLSVRAVGAMTPAEVWSDFDPRAEPLDIEVTKQWTENHINYRELYFTGMTHEGEKVHVYAIYGAPEGGHKLPAVLHIHGGGQTAYVGMVKFWAERGYAVLSFDYTGKWEQREKYTLWGKLVQGNTAQTGNFLQATEPSVRVSTWYLWTRVSRRALTCLEQQAEVDPARLGIFGISNGGSIVWIFAGMDRRVKAACAIYGVGWNTYPEALDEPDPRANDPKTLLWREAMESESYAPLIKCPILFLNSSNDQHGKMDWAFRTLASVRSEWRQIHSPRVRHHLQEPEARDLVLWMDTWLKGAPAWPKTPQANVDLGRDGVPRLAVRPDAAKQVEQVDLFYAVENRKAKNRFWRSAPGTKHGPIWEAPLPILDARQPLFAFANVHYRSGVSLGSVLVTAMPGKLGQAKATECPTTLIDDFSQGVQDWVTSSTGTDPVLPITELLASGKGPDGQHGVTVKRPIMLMTHKIGDPKWRAPTGARLEFETYLQGAREIKVIAHENEFVLGHKKYQHVLQLEPGAGWQKVTLHASEMKTDDGEELGEWSKANALELTAKGAGGPEPIYMQFRWTK